jgi:glycosyltransferase involved in cell wall biosynthesis
MYVARSSSRVADEFGERLERLSREGFDVHVLAGPDGGCEELVERGIHCRALPVVYRPNIPGLIGAFFIIQAYFIEQRPVLVHVHDGVLAWLAGVAASRASVPAIFATLGDHGFDDSPTDLGAASVRFIWPDLVEALEEQIGGVLGRMAAPVAERGREWMVRHLGDLVDRYVVTADREMEELEERGWIPAEKLERVIGGAGIDVDRFDPGGEETPSRDEAREALGIPDVWRFVVGHAGELQADRGGLDVLRAVDRIVQRRREVGWLFSTETEQSEVLARYERRDRTRIGPDCDDVHLYAAMNVLVHTRTDPGSARVLMQAQAMRIPVVTYDSAANASVVADGQTGYLVPSGDLDALVETLDRVADHPKRLADFGRRARARAAQRFDREYVDSQILRLYDAILEQKL